jgi:type IV secretion system protein VirD4
MATKIQAGKLQWKYPIAKIFIISICAIITTQWAAYSVYYAQFLGEPVFSLLGYPIFSPHQYVLWVIDNVTRWETLKALVIPPIIPVIVSPFIAQFVIMRMTVRDLRAQEDTGHHGTARWATKKDVAKMPFSAPHGVVLGTHKEHGFLVNDSSDLIGVEAPTRSGKGTVIAVPTLLYWPHSVIVTDIKGELWNLTAGFRQKFSHTMRLDPNLPKESVCWNPLLEIRERTEVRDAQNIAQVLITANQDNQKNFDYFKESAKSLLTAFIIHVIYTSKEKTIPYILRLMRNPDVERATTLKVMLKVKHKNGAPHPLVEQKGRELLDLASSPNQLNGVWGTVITALSVYDDPNLATIVSRSDFKLDQLLNAEYPSSLYLTPPPSDIERLDGFFRLFLNLFSQVATETGTGAKVKEGFKYRKVPNLINRFVPSIERRLNKDMYDLSNPHKHRMLMLMDEFPAFKHMPFFEEGLAFVAGYGIKVMLIYQTPNQLANIYGRNHTLVDNLTIRAYFPPDNAEIAERISKALGKQTITVNNATTIGKRGAFQQGNISVSASEQGRELMTASEIMQLDGKHYIIMVKGKPPIFAERVDYFNESAFNRKLTTQAPSISETGELDIPGEVIEEHWNQFVLDPSKLKQILAEIKAEEEEEEQERIWKAQQDAEAIKERKKQERKDNAKTGKSKKAASKAAEQQMPEEPPLEDSYVDRDLSRIESEDIPYDDDRVVRDAEQSEQIDLDRDIF